MCSSYTAVTDLAVLGMYFGVARGPDMPLPVFDKTVWPTGLAPIIRLNENGRRCAEAGNFGLVPHWAKELVYGRRTYNARSETVARLASFRDAWKRSQRCVVPAERIYEPCYESGRAVRWAVEREDGEPMGIAGIWVDHPHLKRENGEPLLSFAMLTVSGEGHVVFQRLHAPEDEKRMVVILDPGSYDQWLTCSPDEATQFFRQWMEPLRAYPAPLPPRKSGTPKPAADSDGDLFPPVTD
ncbi:MAG TPA: SOS response-associated peptidase family protein [Nevskiaceae bacterium]|nr:SOS response-associated peptidase family protein [Nevskiaceae bacterium]